MQSKTVTLKDTQVSNHKCLTLTCEVTKHLSEIIMDAICAKICLSI